MAEQKEEKKGYTIVSYRVRLYDRHMDCLLLTKQLYNRVASHFFSVLWLKKDLLEQSDFLLLRELEILCIGTKELKKKGMTPEFPLESYPKIPLYFRRSAINAAITMARKNLNNSWCSAQDTGIEGEENRIDFPMILYQGMYREFTGNSIEIKLFDGKKWNWIKYPFTGRNFPETAKWMSPVLFFNKRQAYLDVPMRFEVQDVRTVRERMGQEECICAIAFPDYDVSAVAVVMDRQGKEKTSSFFRGGKEREHHRKKLQERLEKSKDSRKVSGPEENKRIYADIRRLNHHYAHTISRQLVDYCLQQGIKVIVVPNYEESINFQNKRYLKTDSYRWLGRAIIKNLKYKAFREGIIVTSVKPFKTTQSCCICGERIRRYNEGHTASMNYYGGKLFICPNGHKGNVALNSAGNIGKAFLGYYKEQKESV